MWLFVLLAAGAALPVLSGTSPTEVPSGVGWERAGGGFVAGSGARISYELLVDPKRIALWAITRYRVQGAGKTEPDDEILIWNVHHRPPDLRCYQRVRRPDASPPAWEWQRVPTGTPVYRTAMSVATEVYGLNRAREIALEEKASRE